MSLSLRSRTQRWGTTAAVASCLVLLSFANGQPSLHAQELSGIDRSRGLIMLRQARKDLERYYYDSTFHGVNLDSVFGEAEARIGTAGSNSDVFAAIAVAMSAVDDSHTWFEPPRRAARIQYGWSVQMVGDVCLIVAVKPGSDAEAKQVEVGDIVHAIDGIRPTRDNLWKIWLALYAIRPRATTRLTLENAEGVHDVLVETDVVPERRVQNLSGSDEGAGIWDLIIRQENLERETRDHYQVIKDSVFVWQMTRFGSDRRHIDDMMSRARAFPGLVLDLRGNHGGADRGLRRLISHLFDRAVVLGTFQMRTPRATEVVEPRRNPYRGRLVVLVDSESASASEIFARTIQLQHRGIVIGDRTAGMVTGALLQRHQIGAGTVVLYATAVTIVDLVMSDGSRLEGSGVVPDEVVLPTAADLREGRDHVLARAIALLGGSLSAEQAGGLFPRRRWR